MRGIKAKKIRREVYGDMALRVPRKYIWFTKTKELRNHPKSLRWIYQMVKKLAKRGLITEKA